MTEFSVGDRVLVPGVVVGGVSRLGEQMVRLTPGGGLVWPPAIGLRPDTGGRDLTGQDIADALDWHSNAGSLLGHHVAEYLNRIARGDAGSAGDDTAPDEPVCHACGMGYSCPEHDPQEPAAAGPRAGADTPRVCDFCGEVVTGHRFFRNLPCGHPVGSRPAGDTAPDDETRPYGCPDDCEDCQYVVDSLRAEVDRLRSDAAALRDAGNESDDVLGALLRELAPIPWGLHEDATAARDRWRSAAGEATT